MKASEETVIFSFSSVNISLIATQTINIYLSSLDFSIAVQQCRDLCPHFSRRSGQIPQNIYEISSASSGEPVL